MPAPCPETIVAGQSPIVRKSPPAEVLNDQTCDVHFATTGAVGIVDLGASQTVIGAQQVKDLIGSLPQHVQSQIQRTSCNLTFRLGNHQTLTSRHAIVLPLGQAKFQIAIVPGETPFLLSSSFLKGIQAIIDADQGTIWSKRLNKELHVERSSKNLFLMDICQLWADPNDAQPVQESDAAGFTCHPVIAENTESRSGMHHGTHNPRSHASGEKGQRSEGTTQPQKMPSCQVQHSSDSRALQPEQPSERSAVINLSSVACVSQHDVSVPNAAEVPRQPAERGSKGCHQQDPPHTARDAGEGEDHLRSSQAGNALSGSVPRCQVDGLVHSNLREEWQTRTPNVRPICDETHRRGDHHGAPQGLSKDINDCHQQQQSDIQGCDRVLGSNDRTGDAAGFRVARDQQSATDGRTGDQPLSGEQEPLRSDGWHGDGNERVASTCLQSECEERTVESAESFHAHHEMAMPDLDFDFMIHDL